MPAKSEKQATAARIARGIQKGEVKPKAGTASAEMAKMPAKSLKHFTKMEEAQKLPKPDALKKIVQYLAKEAEEFQNFVGVDAPYDVSFDTINDIVTDSGNKRLQAFWKGLSSDQQFQVFEMIHQYLVNNEIKKDPEYFGGEKAKQINYNLTPKPSATIKGTPKLEKVIQHLAKKAEDWKNYEGLDSPEEITFAEFLNFVVDDPQTSPAVKKFWYSLGRGKQDELFNKIINLLADKYGSGDDMYENVSLSKMAERVVEEKKSAPLMLNGKEVDKESIELDGVDPRDYPDFSDAYISDASYVDGTPLSPQDIEQLEKENYGLVNDLAHGQLF